METYRVRAEAISKAEIFDHEFALGGCIPGNIETPTVVGAQVANELLNITDVKASFVFTNMKGTVLYQRPFYGGGQRPACDGTLWRRGPRAIAGAQLKKIFPCRRLWRR